MYEALLADLLHGLGGELYFCVYGRAKAERDWRVIRVYASRRRDPDSRWPLFRNCCTTWGPDVIAVGRVLAASVFREQQLKLISREAPQAVSAGRLRSPHQARSPSASEILAHECGHTWQAIQLGAFYLPLVGTLTLFREGPYPWNRFENEASAQGLYGGIVPGSVSPRLAHELRAGALARVADISDEHMSRLVCDH